MSEGIVLCHMSKNAALLVSSWVATAALVFAACGSDSVQSDGHSAGSTTIEASRLTTTPGSSDVEPSLVVTEQNVPEARVSLDAAREKWDAAALTDYRLEVWSGPRWVHLEIVGGEAVSEELGRADGAGVGSLDFLPRSMEEVFQAVEDRVAGAEKDPSRVRPPDECGYHFTIEFAQQTGFPTYYDSLGPCDDGDGIRIVITT